MDMPKRASHRQPSPRHRGAEARTLRDALHGFCGTLAVQIGGGNEDWLGAACFTHTLQIGCDRADAVVCARAQTLPLEEASVDLLLLIHVLGDTATPAPVLAEAARVLRGEGRLVVVERRLPRAGVEWRRALSGRLLRCMRLRRLVVAAGLEWCGGRGLARSRSCLRLGHGAYAALAVKRVSAPRMIRPNWKQRHARRQTVLQEHGHAG